MGKITSILAGRGSHPRLLFADGHRARGRPRKTPSSRPCTIPFDTIALQIIELACDRPLWNAAKDFVRASADSDPSLAPTSRIVLNYLVDHINRSKGYDFHGIHAIGRERAKHPRTVQKAFHELIAAGIIVRRFTLASKRWETTIPALLEAAAGIRKERAARNKGKETLEYTPRTRPKITVGTPEKYEGHAQTTAEEHAQTAVLIPIESNTAINSHTNPVLAPHPRGRDDHFEFWIAKIKTPGRARVIKILLDPLLRERQFEAPDPIYALGRIADTADRLTDDLLRATLVRLRADRNHTVKASDLERAVARALHEYETQVTAASAVDEALRKADQLFALVSSSETSAELADVYDNHVRPLEAVLPEIEYRRLISACRERDKWLTQSKRRVS